MVVSAGVVSSRGIELYSKILGILGRSQNCKIAVFKGNFRGRPALVQLDYDAGRVGTSFQIAERSHSRLDIAPGGRATISCDGLRAAEEQQVVFAALVVEEVLKSAKKIAELGFDGARWCGVAPAALSKIISLPNSVRQNVFSGRSGHPPVSFTKGQGKFRLFVSEGAGVFSLSKGENRASVSYSPDGSVCSIMKAELFGLHPFELVRLADKLLVSGQFHKGETPF